MDNQHYSILTTAGAEYFAHAVATGTPIVGAEFMLAVGDSGGQQYEPDVTQTSLIAEKWRDKINDIYTNENDASQIVVEGIIPMTVGGWFIREWGVYNKEGTLIAVGSMDDTFKSTLASGIGKQIIIQAILDVENAAVLELIVDPNVVVANKSDIAQFTNPGGDKKVGSSYGQTVFADYEPSAAQRVGSFSKGFTITDKRQALEYNGGWYLYTGADSSLPYSVRAGVTPGNDFAYVGSLSRAKVTDLYASQFGAKPGQNVSDALIAMSKAAQKLKTGFRLFIDCGTVEVFYQKINPSPTSITPYYISCGDLIYLNGCSDFTIDFTGSSLVTKSGLHYGSFYPLTGQPYSGQTTATAYAAAIGWVINLTNCNDYQIINLDFDGKNIDFVKGGGWGDKGIQLNHGGTREVNCYRGMSINTRANYCGLDGTYIGISASNGECIGITHINPKCQYNGRQGLSITGGNNITILNPDYSYTGRGGVSSSPSAGIDIEPNGAYYSHGVKIINPKMVDNVGPAFLSLAGKGMVVEGGEGVGQSVLYVQPVGVEVTFNDFLFNGSVDNSQGRRMHYNRCVFTDETRYGVTPTGQMIRNILAGSKFTDCEIRVGLDKFYITAGVFENVKITISAASPVAGARAGVFRPTRATDVTFSSNYADAGNVNTSGNYTYIDITNTYPGIHWLGKSSVNGEGLAIASRTGSINSVISTVKPAGIYNNGVKSVAPKINGDGTVDIPIEVGCRMLTIVGLAPVGFQLVVAQNSTSSSSANLHKSVILSAILSGLGTTASASVVVIGGADYVRISAVTADVSGQMAVITQIALLGTTVFNPVS